MTGNQQLMTPNQAQIDLIKRTVFPQAQPDELALYLHDCARQGVHPLDRLIHPQIRMDRKTNTRRYVAVISIDLMRSRADETGQYVGSDQPVFSGAPRTPDFAATVTVYRSIDGQRCPFSATVWWSEYCPPEGQDQMWRYKPRLMLGKCAEMAALRKAFPRQLRGLMGDTEMHLLDDRDQSPSNDVAIISDNRDQSIKARLAERIDTIKTSEARDD